MDLRIFMYVAAALLSMSSLGVAAEAQQSNQGTVTMPSGLKIEVLKQAPEGAISPEKGNKVTVHYTGWLDDNGKPGKKFDSSVDRGTPFVFTIGVGQVIQGWDLGVMSMKKGETARLFIPAGLGYGARGAGGAIPPNSALIFDVELIDIKK
jgi:peptidylprolyl isomerase